MTFGRPSSSEGSLCDPPGRDGPSVERPDRPDAPCDRRARVAEGVLLREESPQERVGRAPSDERFLVRKVASCSRSPP